MTVKHTILCKKRTQKPPQAFQPEGVRGISVGGAGMPPQGGYYAEIQISLSAMPQALATPAPYAGSALAQLRM